MTYDLTGRELADLIADHIEAFPEEYDQEVWGSPSSWGVPSAAVGDVLEGGKCNSPACVAGWAVRIAYDKGAQIEQDDYTAEVAGVLLELDETEHDASAYSDRRWLFDSIRHQDSMVAILRHYAATGQIDRDLEPSS